MPKTMGSPKPSTEGRPISTLDFLAMKERGEKIVMTTAYDALFASLVDRAGVDAILVGDSVATVLGGHETTLPATVEQMIYHGRMVRRGTHRALVVVDMPFLSYQVSVEEALRNAGTVLKQTGAAAVKLEGGQTVAPTIRALVDAGIPVMGHLGLTPQSVHALGGYRIQGKEESAVEQLIADPSRLEEAGVFSIVLELIPAAVAERVSEAVSVPTIGIGAGPGCDGQVLVLHDLLGFNEDFQPKFLKRYAELGVAVREALTEYGRQVRSGEYPDATHSH